MATVATMTIVVTKDDTGTVVATIDTPATTLHGVATVLPSRLPTSSPR